MIFFRNIRPLYFISLVFLLTSFLFAESEYDKVVPGPPGSKLQKPGPKPFGLAVQIKMGYSPILYRDFFQGTSTTTALLDRIQNRIDQVNRFYTNLSNYSSRRVVTNFQYDNDLQYTLPVGLDLSYTLGSFTFEIGVSFASAAQTNMSYDLTLGPSTVRFDDTTITAYQDIHENADLDSTVVPQAYGLYPTEGKPIRFSMHTRAEMLVIPFTVFFNFVTRDIYTLSLGTGISYYSGLMERSIYAEKIDKYDIDSFKTSTFGFHFVFRGSVQLFAQSYLFVEARFLFATSNAVKDSYITGAGTLDSLFHENAGSDWGGGETPDSTGTSTASNPVPGRGVTRSEALDFTGIEYYIGAGVRI